MVNKIYLDGCSFVYGQGLARDESLSGLFRRAGCNITDNSRCGKSNISIAMDTYKNYEQHDVFMLGFSYSARFGIKYQDFNLDFFPGYHGSGLPLKDTLNTHEINHSFNEFHRYFYTLFGTPYCDDLSDFIVDSLASFLKSQGKKIIFFSWEKRNTRQDIFYPYIGPGNRLPDGHLNADGTKYLFQLLNNLWRDCE